MTSFPVTTGRRTEFIDITPDVQKALDRSGLKDGLVIVFVPHTTAGVTINEGADPSVQEDILNSLNRVIPSQGTYRHGEGNSPAHIKASLMGSSVTVMVEQGRLLLGTWQAIFFCEFDGPRSRKFFFQALAVKPSPER
jgi:secondary thiamine-phosphate synthase enzyme